MPQCIVSVKVKSSSRTHNIINKETTMNDIAEEPTATAQNVYTVGNNELKKNDHLPLATSSSSSPSSSSSSSSSESDDEDKNDDTESPTNNDNFKCKWNTLSAECNHDKSTNDAFVKATPYIEKLYKHYGSYIKGLIERNKIRKLYNLMRTLKRDNIIENISNVHICCVHCYCEKKIATETKECMEHPLPKKYLKEHHPPNFKPVQHTQNFLDKDGDVIWDNIEMEKYDTLYDYLSKGIEYLQNPINGNTIFHENSTLLFIFIKENLKITKTLNWKGDQIIYPALKDFEKIKHFP